MRSPAGTAFIPLDLLEAVQEADHSLGLGGATLIHDRDAQRALEAAGLIHVEIRGGVFTDQAQKSAIKRLISRYLADQQPQAESRAEAVSG